MKSSLMAWIVFRLLTFQFMSGQEKPWLTDEKARDIAGATIHAKYPQPCYSTYRKEQLEDLAFRVRKVRTVGDHLNNSVYFYSVASDVCDYVAEKDGKPVLMSQVSSDCCEYGIVAVDRITGKSYWFTVGQPAVFEDFVRDEELQPDLPRPVLFMGLYLELVRGGGNAEITSLDQLRDSVQDNFQSAYSPYERDNKWQHRFDAWWRKFRAQTTQVKFEATYESTGAGTIVKGYGFRGFALTIPRSDSPPKGTATVFEWALLVKSDGTVEVQPSKAIFSRR